VASWESTLRAVGSGKAPVATLLLVACAALSGVRHAPESWERLGDGRARDAPLSANERVHAPIDALPLPSNVFDFYRDRLRRGDRYYLQVLPSGFGPFADLPTVVATVARFYLLPAVQVATLEEANVVLSWEADPGLLGIRFAEQHRAGLQLFFVSRIAE
jgi:hypothetical protein